ncbi:protein EMSY-LIKE 1-like isoform X2 [Cucumis melo var. makuwa]|uniref:Protein EMSY-LIKE 1-like isoform X2 n=1 Tax=Cucumis melo var. makuwa TaxID=1194695 RepID=A0A5A7TK75_CUCMM|nr:protein EMSY-LIKE 1-like isoform X2 [Cucumis melo var. makuwa]TYK25409.1 protein EMSY-LIKE 1-like isoform X2 [Cucumis melo var. makuwa]
MGRLWNEGTDDDLPPSRHNRVSRGGRVSGKGMPALSSFPYSRVHDMEAQIHHLEQEAYCSVLRAFKAQADAITWDKESLITELRKELRVSDDEHRELLARVNSDDIIREIREWRQAGGHLNARRSSAQPIHDVVPSPTVSASRKKQKTSQLNAPLPSFSSMKPMQYSSSVPAGSRQLNNHGSSGTLLANESAEAPPYDTLIGRKVWTRWPEDNSFYEAVIKDYDPVKGQHALVYDINTARETWEWVDIKEIPPEDIRWDNEDPGMTHRGGHGGQSRVYRRSQSLGGGGGRGRGHSKSQSRKEVSPSQNGVGKKVLDDIELLNTEALVQEVEKVFNTSNPDPAELEKAKKMLKDHEQALVDAISRLTYASDGESGNEYMCT